VDRALLFDVDGVLVDSYQAYRRIWTRWSNRHGLDADVVWAATHGRRSEDTIAEVAPELEAPAEYLILRRYMNEDGISFPLFPAAADLLTALPPSAWGLVTSGRSTTVKERLQAGGAPVPSVLVDGSMVAQGKPHPEGYLLAARLLGVQPEGCLVCEDAPAGIQAARAAGMRVLALGTTHDELELEEADKIVGSLSEAVVHLKAWLV
jgi:sugar-phosphatase